MHDERLLDDLSSLIVLGFGFIFLSDLFDCFQGLARLRDVRRLNVDILGLVLINSSILSTSIHLEERAETAYAHDQRYREQSDLGHVC